MQYRDSKWRTGISSNFFISREADAHNGLEGFYNGISNASRSSVMGAEYTKQAHAMAPLPLRPRPDRTSHSPGSTSR